MESKGGVDGTTGQSLYKQYTAEDTLPDETAILYTAVVPLKLYVKETGIPLHVVANFKAKIVEV